MLCPFCQKEMETGVLESVLDICWLPKAAAPFRKPRNVKGAECLESEGTLLQFFVIAAFRCRACKKIIINQ